MVGKRRAFYPVVAGIILYTLLVGADASVTRAAIMGLLVALANRLNRRSLALVSLFAAGLVMTALNPLTLWDVGFQLSFLATLSLVLFATSMTERFERLMARLPFASASVNLSAAGLVGYYALLAVGMLVRRPSIALVGSRLSHLRSTLGSSKMLTSAATLLLAVCPLLFVTLDSLPDGKLHVHFLDVGQGEAVLIITPDGQQVLIDGGASPTALLGEMGRLMPFYDRQIELVILTHAGDERVGGLLGLAQRYRIGQVVQAPLYPSTQDGSKG
jgi:predicted membrane metal-binding protein